MTNPKLQLTAIEQWFTRQNLYNVSMSINCQPINDPYDDYQVLFEIVFRPMPKECTQIEIWICDDGTVAIGVDRYQRLSDMDGTPCIYKKPRFLGGFEPLNLSPADCVNILELAKTGGFDVMFLTLPVLGIIDAKVFVRELGLAESVCGDFRFFKDRFRFLRLLGLYNTHKYLPWS